MTTIHVVQGIAARQDERRLASRVPFGTHLAMTQTSCEAAQRMSVSLSLRAPAGPAFLFRTKVSIFIDGPHAA